MKAILLLVVLGGWQIETLETVITERETLRTEQQVFLEDLKVKITGSLGTFIVDMKKGKITLLLEDQKVFSDAGLEEWAEMAGRIREAMALPLPKRIEVKKIEGGPKILGYKTTEYGVYIDGVRTQRLFVGEGLMAPEFSQLERALSKINPGRSFVREMVSDSLRALTKGLVLRAESKENGVMYVSEIVSLKEKKMPPLTFTPSRDFKRISLDEFFRKMALGSKKNSP